MTVVDTVRDTSRALWGKPARSSKYEVDGYSVEVLKWEAKSNPENVVIYLTVGASAFPLPDGPADHRHEFFIGLLPARDQVANSLAALSLYSVREGVMLDHGHTVPADGALWRGSAMTTFLITRPRSDLLPPLESPDGTTVEFLQAIPIFESERAYKKEHGVDALMECFAEQHTPFWDPDRSPNPVCLSRSGLGSGTFLGV
ncbi:MAG TPA: suppressor of fused domain protein [Candidatus Limnocylindrales bacterium]